MKKEILNQTDKALFLLEPASGKKKKGTAIKNGRKAKEKSTFRYF